MLASGQRFGHLEVVHLLREVELKTIRVRTWLVRCHAPVLRPQEGGADLMRPTAAARHAAHLQAEERAS